MMVQAHLAAYPKTSKYSIVELISMSGRYGVAVSENIVKTTGTSYLKESKVSVQRMIRVPFLVLCERRNRHEYDGKCQNCLFHI